jgi:NADH:ubiquinone oxidoreductase subunit C
MRKLELNYKTQLTLKHIEGLLEVQKREAFSLFLDLCCADSSHSGAIPKMSESNLSLLLYPLNSRKEAFKALYNSLSSLLVTTKNDLVRVKRMAVFVNFSCLLYSLEYFDR